MLHPMLKRVTHPMTTEHMHSTYSRLALLALGLGLAFPTQAAPGGNGFTDFIRAKGDQLIEGNRNFRFISFNIPNLLVVEDNMPFDSAEAWRLPDRFEVNDALTAVGQAGGTVVRTYVVSVQRTNDLPGVPRHVLGPGRFNEDAFRAMDLVMQVANQTGVRVILPLIDNWNWWGGVADYAAFRGKPRDAFWTDPQLIADFQETIRFVVERRNTLTGLAYRDDKALLGWEVGNELRAPADWIRRMAAYIKSLDSNHLVIDGFQDSALHDETLAAPEIDVVTTHHYPGSKKSFAELVRENAARAKGRKPYFVGEFGFVGMKEKAGMLEAVADTGMSGALLWSLRYRSRDGGFYWHSEPAGGNKYKAYHWPGFASGAGYDEIAMLALLRTNAYKLRGLPVPPQQPPAPPRLLPVHDTAAALTWQGSAGAVSYEVQRASKPSGPWMVVGADVDETEVQHRPLFIDGTAPQGRWYYRVLARGPGGISPPSKVLGPVRVTESLFVDDMRGTNLVQSAEGALEAKTLECRRAKEDAHRLAGGKGSALIYRVDGPIRSCRVDAFITGEPPADLRFSVSEDGQKFRSLTIDKRSHDQGPGDYAYWPAWRYEARVTGGSERFLRIEFTGDVQVGRVEVRYR